MNRIDCFAGGFIIAICQGNKCEQLPYLTLGIGLIAGGIFILTLLIKEEIYYRRETKRDKKMRWR